MSKISPCNDVLPQLPLFVGGDLEAHLEAGVRDHLGLDDDESLSGCAPCREVLESLAASRSAILELPALSPAPRIDVWPGVLAALDADGRLARRSLPAAPAGGERAPRARLRLVSWRPAAAAAAVLLAAFGIYSSSVQQPVVSTSGEVGGVARNTTPDEPVADSVLALSEDQLLRPVRAGGLRRLEPGELPMGAEALPFIGGMDVITPGMESMRPTRGLRPVAPTLASYR